METASRILVIAGVALILVGGGLYVAGRLGIPLGRLPGDIRIEGRTGTFYFPLVSSIVLSFLLTILLNVILRLFHK